MKDSEEELLARARAFEEKGLVEVYDRFSPEIFRYAMRFLGSPDQAEECVSETFRRFLEALKKGKGPRSYLRAYLYRTAHNWVTDFYRRQPLADLPLEPNLHADPEGDPSRSVAIELERQEVRRALLSLTSEQRQVIVLKYLEDWSNQEVAKALEKPVGAVKSLQHRALNALRRALVEPTEETR